MFLISAFAAAPQAAPNPMASLIMFLPIIIIFGFMMWSQRKKQKQTTNMLAALEKGDEVMTAGGMIGRISKIQEHYVLLALGEGVEIRFQKGSIIQTLPKGTIKSIDE